MGFFDRLLKKEADRPAADSPEALRYGAGGGEAGLQGRLEYIIGTEWSGYTLYPNVPAADLDAEPGARDYTYGLFLDGEPKAMIMVLCDSNHYRRSDVVRAKEACERNGIPYMNFMAYLPSSGDYIANRLCENILR